MQRETFCSVLRFVLTGTSDCTFRHLVQVDGHQDGSMLTEVVLGDAVVHHCYLCGQNRTSFCRRS